MGTSVQTPQSNNNLPGLASLSYRVGTWATFKESMLARLSSSDYPALAALKTRSDDDFTIAFLDATSIVLDILTFYQERVANESYLGTATQLRSQTELSRLIGYKPSPGVSADVYLAFTLKAAPGQTPDPSTPAITIPAGTQVQSVPAQGQTPQTFETSADIPAKSDWNALQVQTDQPWMPQLGDTSVYLQGTATQLHPGDLILIVGDERLSSISSNNWDVRVVTTVEADSENSRTYVEWSEGLGYDNVQPSQQNPTFYALRQRAALFGYNAINPLMLAAATLSQLQGFGLITTPPAAESRIFDPTKPIGTVIDIAPEWEFGSPGSTGSNLIDLDAVYSKIVPQGWIVLIEPDSQSTRSPAGFVSLYLVQSITTITRSAYAISAKISRARVDTNTNLDEYYGNTRETSVFAQSDELEVAPQPLTYPLYGTALDLEELRPDLAGVQAVAISGKNQKIAVAENIGVTLLFVPDDSTTPVNLNPGDVLTVTAPPGPNSDGTVPDWSSSSTVITLSVQDASGRTGTVQAALNNFTLGPSLSSDPEVEEYALVNSVISITPSAPQSGGSASPVNNGPSHTRISLQSNLLNCYDRSVTTVNANVVLATHGQSVSEIMGSGSASTPDQNFTLKQSPLTFVQAPTPTGGQSTLEVQVNGAQWNEVPTLYDQGLSQPVFATLNQSDGTTDVLFGDGVEGSTLPTGQNNVQANYRIGLGSVGNVSAGSITTLIDRPLGVSGVSNPAAATGGQDPQSVDQIRANAPQTVLTLGRAVSITDYQNYAASFAGIGKAYAIWIPSGLGRGVFLTVAGIGGVAFQPGDPTLSNLATSLRNYGNPLIPVTVQSFVETLFSFSASLLCDPAYDPTAVQADVLETISNAFEFEARTFGQSVGIDEITATIQAVSGIVAVNVTGLTRLNSSTAGDLGSLGTQYAVSRLNKWLMGRIRLIRLFTDPPNSLTAYLPVANTQSLPQPAEILVVDPTQVILGAMS